MKISKARFLIICLGFIFLGIELVLLFETVKNNANYFTYLAYLIGTILALGILIMRIKDDKVKFD